MLIRRNARVCASNNNNNNNITTTIISSKNMNKYYAPDYIFFDSKYCRKHAYALLHGFLQEGHGTKTNPLQPPCSTLHHFLSPHPRLSHTRPIHHPFHLHHRFYQGELQRDPLPRPLLLFSLLHLIRRQQPRHPHLRRHQRQPDGCGADSGPSDSRSKSDRPRQPKRGGGSRLYFR